MEIDRAEIDCLLESCLDEMSGGQESIDSVLSRHPDVQENLRAELEAALWFRAQAQRLAARPGFIPRSRRHLYTQIRKEHPDRQFFKRKKMLQRWEKSPAAQLVLSILLVIALLANTNSLLAAARAAGARRPVLRGQAGLRELPAFPALSAGPGGCPAQPVCQGPPGGDGGLDPGRTHGIPGGCGAGLRGACRPSFAGAAGAGPAGPAKRA
jgi:hypothetical protein